MARSLLFPSAAILLHILGVAPIFITSAISFMGLCQFLLGMRENKIIGFLVILISFPFMYPSVLGGLVLGDVNAVVSWHGVSACLIVSALLFAITAYLSRYLNKERIVMTIPE
jgi:ABC-2 type transport system permease protein